MALFSSTCGTQDVVWALDEHAPGCSRGITFRDLAQEPTGGGWDPLKDALELGHSSA